MDFLFWHLKMIHTEQAIKDNLPNIEIKDYNVMIEEKNFLDQPIKNDKTTNENI